MNIKTNNWNHNSYITVNNILDKKDIQVIIKDIDKEIKSNPAKDSLTGIQTKALLHKIYKTKPWLNYFKKIKDIAGMLGVSKLKECWALKIEKQQTPFLHNHAKSKITSVFYLQNPDVFCGTYLNQDGKDIIIPGHENSLVVFDGKIFHDAVFTTTKLLKNKPRYTLITDFN